MSKSGKIKISDIAKAAGVAPSTVSYALNGGRPISEETRALIMQEVERLGYRPNAIARSFSTKKTETIGLYVPKQLVQDDLALLENIRGISSVIDQHGYKLMLINEIDGDSGTASGRTFPIDGAIVTSCRAANRHMEDLRADDIPFVLLGRPPKQADALYVDSDNQSKTYQIVELFFKSGLERVAMAMDPISREGGQLNFLSGYIQAYSDYQKAYDEELILHISPEDPMGVESLQKQLSLLKADAVVLTNITNPVFRSFLVSRGPEELVPQTACFGYDLYRNFYDGLSLAPFIDIPSNAFAIGEQCAHMLMSLILEKADPETIEPHLFQQEPVLYYGHDEVNFA